MASGYIAMGLATVALYWPALQCDFVNFDDPDYVTANIHGSKTEITFQNLKWALTSSVSAIIGIL